MAYWAGLILGSGGVVIRTGQVHVSEMLVLAGRVVAPATSTLERAERLGWVDFVVVRQ